MIRKLIIDRLRVIGRPPGLAHGHGRHLVWRYCIWLPTMRLGAWNAEAVLWDGGVKYLVNSEIALDVGVGGDTDN